MLVLSRKEGERIVVPSCEVTITVLECRGNHVKLGIVAPTRVGVYRAEVWRRIEEEGSPHPAKG